MVSPLHRQTSTQIALVSSTSLSVAILSAALPETGRGHNLFKAPQRNSQ
jgi:hypothetical protein